MKLFMILLVCFFLMLVLFLLVFSLSQSLKGGFADKSSSFECGFYSFTSSSLPFSFPFFVISLMFLLFDVEVLMVCFFPLGGLFSFYSLIVLWWVILFIFFCHSLWVAKGGSCLSVGLV